jgi:hypothetical protein
MATGEHPKSNNARILPNSVAVDAAGNIFIADGWSFIRKVTSATQLLGV